MTPEAEAQVGLSFPGAWGTLSLVAPAVERASRSYNLGDLSLGRHLTSYLLTHCALKIQTSVEHTQNSNPKPLDNTQETTHTLQTERTRPRWTSRR